MNRMTEKKKKNQKNQLTSFLKAGDVAELSYTEQ